MGWAIDTNYSLNKGLVGIGWFKFLEDRKAGHNIMVWPTRGEARMALKVVRVPYGFPKARVVKVEVTIRAVC